MSTQLVPLSHDKLPIHLRDAQPEINKDLGEKAKPKFPFMSLEGKSWTIVRGKDDRETLTNDDGDPRSAIDVVIVRSNPKDSKVYYEGQYEKGADSKPTCYSNAGDVPEDDAQTPQSTSCAKCKHNVWGTGGNGKGFACRSTKRLAIATPDQLDDPMLLRLPPTSITLLKEYSKTLRNYPYNSVVTRLKFDAQSATPLVTFQPIGALPSDTYHQVKEMYNTDVVRAILGLPEDDEAPVLAAPKNKAEAVAETPAVTVTKTTKKTPTVVKAAKSLDDELDAILKD
jgi:hypothetical protein